uniref:uncharacterized protein LOC122605303 n=1 Tax=Erigeron canadensis TaxID=72917 RepID=UPI001CB94C49|nr:uncharacterized protein LOC122605303 [Erigeron canadensis]
MDNKVVTVDMACCFESEMILVHLEDGSRGPVSIRIPSKIMAAVESFCIAPTKVNHSCGGDAKYASRLLEDFDRQFASQHPLSLLVQFMHAAMKLRIRSLLDLTRAEILKRIKGKTNDEIFKIIDIPRMTHQDFQRARVVHDWAFNIK